MLDEHEYQRYDRQIALKCVDIEGQERLKATRILVIGAGGLGSAAAPYLASSGVGHITISDFDKVELSNLHRQTCFTENDIGRYKSEAMCDRLLTNNSHISCVPITSKQSSQLLTEAIIEHDLVLDCTDNKPTRELINEICWQQKTLLISGSAIRTEGQVGVFTANKNEACYQCISSQFSDAPSSCVMSGILPPVVGIIGLMQALIAVNSIVAPNSVVTNAFYYFDGLSMEWIPYKVKPAPACKTCG
ncbi:HesA/MoeB/ThiF family protein [Salinivibrio costicola]|uniref:HesA/MoeB/ThiF family protein n=1 Tax=Salinivibrio costicola TaxID=51367 RepID=UPI000395AE9A|nr:ThiF family adenylyltransferase [Salinivibrio costicola]